MYGGCGTVCRAAVGGTPGKSGFREVDRQGSGINPEPLKPEVDQGVCMPRGLSHSKAAPQQHTEEGDNACLAYQTPSTPLASDPWGLTQQDSRCLAGFQLRVQPPTQAIVA